MSKKYVFKMNDKTMNIVYATLSLPIILTSISGCSKDSGKESAETVETSAVSIETSVATSQTTQETNETTTETTINYWFPWEEDETVEFDEYIQSLYGKPLRGYLVCFGFTDELNEIYTQFINDRFKTDYDYVPFSECNYFCPYVLEGDTDAVHMFTNDYNTFYKGYLRDDKVIKGVFNNKLIASYLYSNNIPLGQMIDIENLRSLQGENIYSFYEMDYLSSSSSLGNNDSSYEYSNGELSAVVYEYNIRLSTLCIYERIKDRNLLNSPETCEILNGYLKEFYGENAPQLGQVITKEQYISMFGEEPLDLSYIPGAVVKDSEVKGSAKARYNDDFSNYDVAYMPGYEYYTEETESTRSR